MSLAAETRQKVNTNISESKKQPRQQNRTAQTQASDRSVQQQNVQPSQESIKQPLGAENVSNRQQNANSEALQINQNSAEERQNAALQLNQEETSQSEDDTLHLNAPALNAPGLNLPGKNVKKEDIGKIEKPKKERHFEGPDWGPIKIEEGDIIDYMMKEWVLAGAGWLGGKAAGLVGYGIYRGSVAAWDALGSAGRKIGEWYREGKRKRQAANSRSQNAANTTPNRTVGNGDLSPHEPCPSDTPSFCNRIQSFLQKSYELNQPSHNQKALKNLAAAAAQGKLNEHKAEVLEMKNSKTLFTALEKLQKDIKEKPENSKELQGSFLLMMETATEAQKAHNHFCANYAAAQMMQQKQKNPEAFADMSNKELTNMFGQLQSKGKAVYAVELGKINKGTSNYTDAADLLNESTDALMKARENLEKGNYAEKGKQPKNEALDRLNSLASDDNRTSESSKEQTMTDTVEEFNRKDAQHHTEQQAANNELSAGEANEQANNQKRKGTTQTKSQEKINLKTSNFKSEGR